MSTFGPYIPIAVMKRSQLRRVSPGSGVRRKDSAWSVEVKRRDHYCQMPGCFSGMDLQAHHVWPKGRYPDVRFVVENGLTLCQDCHAKWHDSSVAYREWWEKKYPERAAHVRRSFVKTKARA